MIESRDLLIYLAVKYDGDYSSIVHAAQDRIDPSVAEVEECIKKVKSKVLTYFDEEYPAYLRKSPYPPLVLFYYGDISLISDENYQKNVAVIGTRKPTDYGINATETIVKGIAAKYNVVSGLASGIDGVAQTTAILSGGKTIAVLGSGIERVYPTENVDLYHNIINSGGLVVSEYPGYVEPFGGHFLIRNRIIAQLSKGVIVTEAYGRSGTSNTVTYAAMFGRDVLAVPSPVTALDSFTNQLLYEGAIFIRNAKDVLDYFDSLYKPKRLVLKY